MTRTPSNRKPSNRKPQPTTQSTPPRITRRTRRWLQAGVALPAAAALVATMAPSPAFAATTVSDRAGDAHKRLDLTGATVTAKKNHFQVTVQLRGIGRGSVASGPITVADVFFDTDHDRVPEHVVSHVGDEFLTGSTKGWKMKRPPGQPYGNWGKCLADLGDAKAVTVRPRLKRLVIRAPYRCLGNPSAVQVSIRTANGRTAQGTADWMRGARSWTGAVRSLNVP